MTTEYYIIAAIAVAAALTAKVLAARYRHEFVVSEGFVGLLYHKGKLTGSLAAGRHIRWGRLYHIAAIDTRKVLLQVAGQEVLSADNVSVKLSVVLTTQIVDAVKATTVVDNHVLHLYSATQTAIRAAVASLNIDALLGQRIAISTQLRDALVPLAEAIGVHVDAVEVRDVMLAGDLRKAFSEVLKAKQEGLAALERARGESASLRNLANAARLIESHPALATLRFLQTLSDNGAKQTVVMNDMSAFVPTLKARAAKSQVSESGDA